jgi:hypothetical protein
MLLVSDLTFDTVSELLENYGLSIALIADEQAINGSYWGEPEAGIMGDRVFVRGDTPVHSLLHETCHIVCMTPERRRLLDGDAGSDDLEECAVCYLQIVLADELPGAGKERLMQDMNDWGYSFRLGSTRRWFDEDAEHAQAWLRTEGLLQADNRPTLQLRQS